MHPRSRTTAQAVCQVVREAEQASAHTRTTAQAMPMSPSAATTLSNVLAAAASEGFDANGRRINPAPAKQPRSAGGGSRPASKPAKLSLGGGGIKKGKGRGKVATPRPQATKAKGKQQHPANWSENTELTDLAATSAAATPDQQHQQQMLMTNDLLIHDGR